MIDLFVCKGTNTKSLISMTNSDGIRIINEIIEVNVVSQNELFKEAVENSDLDKFSIVLYSNIMSILEPDKVTDFICDIIQNIKFDIFYLTRYGDDCRSHEDFHTIKKISVMKVLHAHGIEAMIISPSGKEFLNGKLIKKDGRGLDYVLNALGEKMSNYSSYPLIYNVDLTKRTNDYELIKGVVCREVVHSIRPPLLTQKNTTSLNLFWFILVIIFIFCIAGGVLTLTDKKNSTNSYEDKTIIFPYDISGKLTSK